MLILLCFIYELMVFNIVMYMCSLFGWSMMWFKLFWVICSFFVGKYNFMLRDMIVFFFEFIICIFIVWVCIRIVSNVFYLWVGVVIKGVIFVCVIGIILVINEL